MKTKTLVDNIPTYVIHINSFSTSRGGRIIVRIDENTILNGTYIRSSIKNVKAIKCVLDGDEYYLFKNKNIGLFMLEKDTIYEMNCECEKWGNLIGL
jgi:hypothetical protein